MEVSVVEYFPEFQTITSCILWIDIVYVDKNKQRITARGHQNGEILVFLVEPLSKVILKQFSICHDGPITRVLLFTSENKVAVPECLEHLRLESNTECDVSDYHLLVVSAVEQSVVYKNVLNKEFSDQLLLPDSNKSDCVMCACAVDIDFDGQNELLLGTYGQELLAYKFQTIAPQEPASPIDNFDELQTMNSRRKAYSFSVSSKKMYKYPTGDLTSTPKTVYKDDSSMPDNWNINNYSPEVDIISDMFNTRPSFSKGQPQAGYQLLWHRSFSSPVVAVEHADVMGDGMDDLIVLTLKGLHILQPNLTNVAEICFNKLNALLNSSMSNDEDEKRKAN